MVLFCLLFFAMVCFIIDLLFFIHSSLPLFQNGTITLTAGGNIVLSSVSAGTVSVSDILAGFNATAVAAGQLLMLQANTITTAASLAALSSANAGESRR